MTNELQVGDLVKATYKTGTYIGEVIQVSSPKSKVRVKAVDEHPKQGDLHNPYQTDVPLFHQRRALAFMEVALVHVSAIEPYEGDVPDYHASLKRAVEQEIQSLEVMNDNAWAHRALQEMQELKKDYFPQS
jgi:kinase-associated protein B